MFGLRFWGVSALYAAGAALLIGIPGVLIPNHLFIRTVPTSPLDYVIWVVSALLIGPLLGLATLYPVEPKQATPNSNRSLAGSGRALAGIVLSFFSVGCPACNKVVVLLLGFGGAMTFFNPLRPFLGLAAIVLMSVTLFMRVRVLRHGCPVRLREATSQRAPLSLFLREEKDISKEQ
jgi:predicted membrane protein